MSDIPQIIQAALLLLVVFLIGCVIGWLLRTVFFKRQLDNGAQAGGVSDESVTSESVNSEPAAQKSATQEPATQEPAKAEPARTAPVKLEAVKSVSAPQPIARSDLKEVKPVPPAPKSSAPARKPAKSAAGKSEAKASKTRPEAARASSSQDKPQGLDAPRGGKKDDLKKIKGVGPKLEGTLNDLGIYHFDQIASWSPKEVAWVDEFLSFKGRIERDNWIEQAKELSSS